MTIVFSPSIIGVLVFWALSINSMVGLANARIPNEIDYYLSLEGVSVDSSFPWPHFQDLDGYFLRVSRQGLRKESLRVLDIIGVSQVYVDRSRGVIWITGITRVQTTEPVMFVYYWIAPTGGSPEVPDDGFPVSSI